MKTLLEAMEHNINAELGVQLGIQELLDRQLDILTQGQVRDLGPVLAEAEAGLKVSARLESERTALLQQLGSALGVPHQKVTLDMIEAAVGEQAASLRESGAQLRPILERIRESNRQVALLLRHSVTFIEDLLHLVLGQGQPARTYTSQGSIEAGARSMAAEG